MKKKLKRILKIFALFMLCVDPAVGDVAKFVGANDFQEGLAFLIILAASMLGTNIILSWLYKK